MRDGERSCYLCNNSNKSLEVCLCGGSVKDWYVMFVCSRSFFGRMFNASVCYNACPEY